MSDKNKKSNRSWVECESKSQPGKKYLFNKASGESIWLKSLKTENKKSTPKKNNSTPANERLKRLQSELRKEKVVEKSTEVDSSSLRVTGKSSKHDLKSGKISKAKEILIKREAVSKEELKLKEKATINKNEIKHKLQEALDTILSRTAKLKPKEICENRNLNKKRPAHESSLKEVVPTPVIEKSSKLIRTTAGRKRGNTDNEDFSGGRECTSSANKRLLQHQKKERIQETPVQPTIKIPELKFLVSSPRITAIPVAQLKGSANKRLKRLRNALQNENKIFATPVLDNSKSNFNGKSPDNEAMDWESIEEPSDSSWSLNLPPFSNSFFDAQEYMEVDDNLMLAAAEEKKTIEPNELKWRKDFLYIVLDTNIFISQLNFIEKLRMRDIIDAPGVILYLPYTVLQELDKLKLRKEIKNAVVGAIKYLNKIFESKDQFVQAQSALEERNQLIEIESSDDNILNCCLQLQANVPNVILLTEDVNLRNKAICNKITVTTKADLIEKKSVLFSAKA